MYIYIYIYYIISYIYIYTILYYIIDIYIYIYIYILYIVIYMYIYIVWYIHGIIWKMNMGMYGNDMEYGTWNYMRWIGEKNIGPLDFREISWSDLNTCIFNAVTERYIGITDHSPPTPWGWPHRSLQALLITRFTYLLPDMLIAQGFDLD